MLVIDNGDAIRGIAEVASQLDFIVNGYVGTTATQLADGQLGVAEADVYLSGANGIVVTSIIIVNTDSVARTFTLYLKPSGGTSRAISPVSLDLGVGYSFYTDGQRVVVLDATGKIQTVATAAAHASNHENAGSDEVSVSGLSGLLADDQHVLDAEVKLIKLDDFATPDDNTDLDASTSVHGLVVKATAPAANILNVVGLVNGETAYTNKPIHDATNPEALGSVTPGTSLLASHRDHVHALPAIDATAAATDITTRNASTSAHGLLKKLDNTATNFMNGQGAWSAPVGGASTKEFLATVHDGADPSASGALIDSSSDDANIHILVPQDFTSLSNIEVIFLPQETAGSMNFSIGTTYGSYAGGEDFNVHAETDAPRDIGAVTFNQNVAHDISDLVDVAALVAGDFIRVRIIYSVTAVDSNAFVRGVRFKYS